MHDVKDMEQQAKKTKAKGAFPPLKKPAEERARARGARATKHDWRRWLP